MKKRILTILLAVLPALCAAQNSVQDYIDRELKTNPNLVNAIVSIYAEDPEGNEIASWNPDSPILTASTLKTITTGIGYRILGPDYRFTTSIAINGEVDDDGTLDGDVYIIGGADPTLGMLHEVAYPVDSIFGIWANALSEAGICRIKGRIIGDDRIFKDEVIMPEWSYSNFSSTSGCGCCGLPFAANYSYYTATPGEKVGDPLTITPKYGAVPDLQIINDAVTGARRSSATNMSFRTNRITPAIYFFGSHPVGRGSRTVTTSNEFGAWTCAYEFFRFLNVNGIEAAGYNEVTNLRRAGENLPAKNDLLVVVETQSPALEDIVYVTNKISQNFFAETIFKMTAKALMEMDKGSEVSNVSYSQAREAYRKYMKGEGLDLTGYTQSDGSGLARRDFVSPRFFCRFYKWMEGCKDFQLWLKSFPQPGSYGTLENVLKKADPEVKATIHAKSGSLSGVKAYAGYVETAGGLIHFAIQVNNLACSTSEVQPQIEGFLEALGKYALESKSTTDCGPENSL